MKNRFRWALLSGAALSLGCAAPTLESRHEAATPAITALQQGSFDRANDLAEERIRADGGDPYPRLVRAIVRYEKTTHQLWLDLETAAAGGIGVGAINQKYLRTALEEAEKELAAVEGDLAVVAGQRGVALELCLACWEVDWLGHGRVDDRDRRLLEIEEDTDGKEIPEGDPRRRPTFRFDDGDVAWARAFVSFERAAIDVVLAYDWTEVGALVGRGRGDERRAVIHLVSPGRVGDARALILEGLDRSDEARRAYLAETDDDREWVPNPRQKSHPLPLPVDQALYDTWEGVVGDVRRLVRGDEGLGVAEIMTALDGPRRDLPRGFLDIGGMLSHPHDLVLDLRDLESLKGRDDTEAAMSSVLGDHYVREMKPSPLPGRLLRVKADIDRDHAAFDRKLRYLFWLN
jgi:hypothetical protein